jgi:hypothetical protein
VASLNLTPAQRATIVRLRRVYFQCARSLVVRRQRLTMLLNETQPADMCHVTRDRTVLDAADELRQVRRRRRLRMLSSFPPQKNTQAVPREGGRRGRAWESMWHFC